MKRTRGVSKKNAFLAAFVETASITKAARAARIDRANHYDWLREDKRYVELFEAAKEKAAATLEDEAVRRAHAGVFEPLVYQGAFSYASKLNEETGEYQPDHSKPLGVRKYSDALLMFLLRGLKPDRYGAKPLEVTGAGGGPIALTVTFVRPPG